MWKDLRDPQPGLGVGAQRTDAQVGMRRQKADQLGPGIATGPYDRDGLGHLNSPYRCR